MSKVICDTSPLQYLFQLGLLELLESLAGIVTVPSAVVRELEAGRRLGIPLPDITSLHWIEVREPLSASVLPLVTDLGAGETAVLALALESEGSRVILDDLLARQRAELLNIPFTGTLGLLLDGKHKGLLPAIGPVLSQLQSLGFRLAAQTHAAVLDRAGELP